MRKGFLILMTMLVAFVAVGCDKGGKEQEKEVLRHDFEASAFAIYLGEDFEEYRMANIDYMVVSKSSHNKFVMAGYIDTDKGTHNIHITVTKNAYGTVESIVATPEHKADAELLMRHYLNNSDKEHLGSWLGANWKESTGAGVHQTVEQALMQLGSDLTTLTIDAIYSVVSGRAYAVSTIEKGEFKLSLVNSFYRLDFNVLCALLGDNWAELQSDNRFISYKSGFGTLNYIWFDYALDMNDNIFNMAAYADEQKLLIKTIRLTMPEDISSQEHIEAWKQYAVGDAALSLGEFQKAYFADNTGAEVSPLASQAAAVEYVTANGRPAAFDNDVVVEYLKGDVKIVITLDAQYVIIDIFR